eukprot:gene7640-10399_t
MRPHLVNNQKKFNSGIQFNDNSAVNTPKSHQDVVLPTVNNYSDVVYGSPRTVDTGSTPNLSTIVENLGPPNPHRNKSSKKKSHHRSKSQVIVRPNGSVVIGVNSDVLSPRFSLSQSHSNISFKDYANQFQQSIQEKLKLKLNYLQDDALLYTPVHFSSGAQSIAGMGPPRTGPDSLRPAVRKGDLWADGEYETLLRREENLTRDLMEIKRKKEKEEHDVFLKIKTIEAIFGKNVSQPNLLQTSVDQTTLNVMNKMLNSNNLQIEQKSKQGEIVNTNSSSDNSNALTKQPKLIQSMIRAASRGEDKNEVKTDEIIVENQTPANAFMDNVSSAFNIKPSKMRLKLNDLTKFVSSYSTRKIMDCWNVIESRIKSSQHHKMVLVKNANGLSFPMKTPAIQLHLLTSILCSSKVKFRHEELKNIYFNLGFDANDILLSRKIAALLLVIGPNIHRKSPIIMEYKRQLQQLQEEEGDKLVTLEELFEQVFPTDPAQREEMVEKVKSRKQMEIQAVLEEKRRRDELKQQADSRRLKMMKDLETTLSDIQLMKGPLSAEKHQQFVDLLVYCKKINDEANDDNKTNLTKEIMSLLGLDVFPQAIVDRVVKGALTNTTDSSTVISTQTFHSNSTRNTDNQSTIVTEKTSDKKSVANIVISVRDKYSPRRVPIRLSGNPTVMALIRETVANGKSLNGIAYREVVGMLQTVAAEIMENKFRCFRYRWRYMKARSLWSKKDKIIKSKYFKEWCNDVKYRLSVEKYCYRKLKAWQFYTKRAIRRREIFRICYWPFRVWRKYSDSSAVAKEKAHFLVHRVMPTLLTLQVFRAWKAYSMKEQVLEKACKRFQDDRTIRYGAIYFYWLKDWTRKRKKIKKAWQRNGKSMRNDKVYVRQIIPFVVWKTYVYYRKLARNRVKEYAIDFRNSFLKGKAPLKLNANSEKRIKIAKKNAMVLRKIEEDKNQRRGRKSRKSGRRSAARPSSRLNDYNSDDDNSESSTSVSRLSKLGGGDMATDKAIVHFNWKQDTTFIYDLESEDEVEAPRTVSPPKPPKDTFSFGNNVKENDEKNKEEEIIEINVDDNRMIIFAHEESAFPLTEISDLDYIHRFKSEALQPIRERADYIYDEFYATDQWNLLEASMRFHRFGYRAFNNLRLYAHRKAQSRRMVERRIKNLKIKIFGVFVDLYMNGTRRTTVNYASAADQVTGQLRLHHLSQIARRRK